MCEKDVSFHRIANNTRNADVKNIFTILAHGEDEFCHPNLRKKTRNTTLILGNAQSGRTAFARWMSENDARFESKKDPFTPGGYIIFDPDGAVGNSSATGVPKLVNNDNTGQVYYDFSGFFDPRGVAYDIASTYFSKKTIENVNNVKICFLINHIAVTSVGTRDEFTNFVKYIVTLVEDVEKFQRSLLFVATIVNSRHSNLEDDEIVQPMVNFMELVKRNLAAETSVDNSKALKFIDLLTTKQGQTYPRIALFRSPNREAPLRNISLLQENKKRVGKSLQNLLYTGTNSDDFAYAVPKSSHHDIVVIIEDERRIITTDVAKGGDQIEKYYVAKEKLPAPSKDAPFDVSVMRVQQLMNSGHQKMLAIEKSTGTSAVAKKPKECVNKIIDGVANTISNSIELHLSPTLDECDAFHFLHNITGQPTKLECAEGLKNVIEYLDDSQTWYLFVKRLYDRLLNCKLSTDMGTFNITNKDANKKVSETDLKRFLLKDPREPLYFQYNDIKDIILTEFKLDSVQTVANLTNRQTNSLCTENNWINGTGPSVEGLYGTRGYLNDLYLLEKQLYTVENRTSFLPFYQSLSVRVDRYIERRAQNETYSGDFKALRYLQITTASRICNLNNGLDDYVVVDIEGYFGLIEQHLNQYTAALKQVQLRTYKAQYEDAINRQILEAFAMIQETILPEIDKVYDQIYDQMRKLIEIIEELEKQAEEKIKELVEQRNKLAAQLPLMGFMGVLKVATVGLNLFGPMGAVASGASGLIISGVEGYLTPNDKTAISMINASKKLTDNLKGYYKTEKESLKKLLENVEKIKESPDVMELIEKDENYKKTTAKVDELEKLLVQESVTERVYFDEKAATKGDVRQHREQLKKEKENSKNDPQAGNKLKKIDAIDQWLSRVQTALNTAEVGVNAVKDYEKSKQIVSQIDGQIDEVNDLIDQLKAYEQDIRDKLIPEIDDVAKNVTEVLVNSAHQSHVVLDRNNFLLKNLLIDFRVEMDIMLSSMNQDAFEPIRKRVLGCIEKLENGMSTTLQIYDRVQDYQDQAKLADFIAGLNSAEFGDEDPDLQADVDQLEILTKSNLILREYEQALSAYKQYVFPFALIYLTRFDVSPYLQPANPNDRVSQAQKDIGILRQDIIIMGSTVSQHGDAVFSDVRFDMQNVEQKPFFIWRYDVHKEEISKLLRGRRATLQANVLQTELAPYAVKFKEIGIRFLSQNKTVQSELQQLMNEFLIEMTHLGDSHYGCGSKYYIFGHNRMTMIHSVNTENGPQNRPQYYYADDATKKIRSNSPLFSPYAEWEIQLRNRSISAEENDRNFQRLKNFQNLPFDVALEGRGGHIQQGARACREDLSKYYKLGGSLTASQSAKFAGGTALSGIRFNVWEWLTWADFLFRWVTRVRPYNSATPVSYVNSSDVRVSALGLIEEFEQILRNASRKFNVPFESLSFDVVPLMSQLEKKAANGNRTTVGDILYQSVINDNSTSYDSVLGNYTRDEIDKMLKRNNYLI